MWFRNEETGLEFDIEDKDLINNLKKDKNFTDLEKENTKINDEKKEETEKEESVSRKEINAKLKAMGFEGDLRKLTDEDAIAEINKLENK